MATEGRWDAYMTVEGVKGETDREGHEEEIQLINFNFGASNATEISGGGMSVGAVDLDRFRFTKRTDAASADLFRYCCTGKHFPTAKVTLYKAADPKPVPYLVFDFKEVYVTRIDWAADETGNPWPMEDVEFSFSEIKVTYTKTDDTGMPVGEFPAGWNLRKGVAI